MNNFLSIILPKRVSRGDDVKAADYNAVIDVLEKLQYLIKCVTLKSSADLGVKSSSGGTIAWLKRRVSGGTGTAAVACPFGEIITYSNEDSDSEDGANKTGIRGGFVEAGKKTWEVPHKELNLSGDGEWLVWIKVPVTANMDPNQNVTLSGLKTSEVPEWKKIAYDSSDSTPAEYEDKVIPEIFPTVNKGSGVAIIPLGILKIESGRATLARKACGDIIVDHCPGKLTYQRGTVAASESLDDE